METSNVKIHTAFLKHTENDSVLELYIHDQYLPANDKPFDYFYKVYGVILTQLDFTNLNTAITSAKAYSEDPYLSSYIKEEKDLFTLDLDTFLIHLKDKRVLEIVALLKLEDGTNVAFNGSEVFITNPDKTIQLILYTD